jgi:nucleoside-diphosphate-sugar epimerase
MILVTGATGFVGRAVVARLLAEGRSVAVLARPRDGVDTRARVRAALGDAAGAASIDVVEGDLAAIDDTLAPADVGRLRAVVETVIHCAGDTSFTPERLAPYRVGHVDGPGALLRALAGGRLARWAHLSTAFVCGERTGVVHESEGRVGQRFHNVYERVKLDGETVIRVAADQASVDVRVLRPSIVVGPVSSASSTAGGNPSSLFFGFIRLLATLARWPGGAGVRLRIEAARRAAFNIVPLDYVTRAVIALAEHPEAAGGTFHLVVRDPPSQAAMLAMLLERLGLSGVTLLDAASEPLGHPSPLERRVAIMLEPYRAYLTQDVRFDDARAAAVLRWCGVRPPTLTPADVRALVDLAVEAETGAAAAAGSPGGA